MWLGIQQSRVWLVILDASAREGVRLVAQAFAVLLRQTASEGCRRGRMVVLPLRAVCPGKWILTAWLARVRQLQVMRVMQRSAPGALASSVLPESCIV